MAWEMLHVGIIPAHDTFVEEMEQKDKLEKALQKVPSNHPMLVKFNHELEKYRSRTVLYYLILMDENILHPTVKLFDLMMVLLPIWLNFDYENLLDGKFQPSYTAPQLIHHLPEHFLDSIYKFHMGVYRYKQNYLQIVGEAHINELLKLTCLILSEEAIVTNPYIGANFV